MPEPLAWRRLAASLFFAATIWSLLAALTPAAAEIDGNVSAEIHSELRQIGKTLRLEFMSPADLGAAMGEVTALRTKAAQCQQAAQGALDQTQTALAALGKQPEHESADLAKTRKSIEAYKAKAANSLAECRLDVVIADMLVARIDQSQKSLLAEHLTRRGESLIALARENLAHPQVWMKAAAGLMTGESGRGRLIDLGLIVLAAATMGALLGRWAGERLRLRVDRPPAPRFTLEVGHGLASAFARYAAFWTAAIIVAGAFAAKNAAAAEADVATTTAAMGVAGFLSAKIVIFGFLAPPPPARQVSGLPDPLARSFARRLSVLAATVTIGLVLFLDPLRQTLPFYAYDFARAIFVTVLAINLGWLTWLLGHVPQLPRTGYKLRLGLLAGLGAIVAAEWLGYRNLSTYLLHGILESSIVGAGLWVANAVVNEVCAGLDGARGGWTAGLRRAMGLGAEEGFPGLVWLRLLLLAVLTGGAGLLLLRAWGLSNAGTELVLGYLTDGVAIGDMHVIPAKVLTGLLVFAVLLGSARWLKDWTETKWLSHSHMDRGARDAAGTMIGYVGFVLAALTGLSAAGVSLANLAMIASALSVGIGFGLQNIVSNSVAGFILLFERPIKSGDWVVVGSTEGYVKRIRIRATEIRTFEQSDVTVPNSDLITGHVKNWTLRDHLGQAVVPISVPHGSDTELVRRLLLDIARAHPGIVGSSQHDPTKVLFRSFGDSALNFELHFIVRNVEERLDAISDVNFAIDKAFREHGIRG
jgi:small-conductance mechanosensitive channel